MQDVWAEVSGCYQLYLIPLPATILTWGFIWGSLLMVGLDLSAPVDVYSSWVDACEEVAHRKVDKEMAEGGNKASAEDMEFSTYGAGDEPRRGVVGDGDDDLLNDDDY